MNNADLFSALLEVYPDLSTETSETGEILWIVPAERLTDVACKRIQRFCANLR